MDSAHDRAMHNNGDTLIRAGQISGAILALLLLAAVAVTAVDDRSASSAPTGEPGPGHHVVDDDDDDRDDDNDDRRGTPGHSHEVPPHDHPHEHEPADHTHTPGDHNHATTPDWSGPMYPVADNNVDFAEAIDGAWATYSNFGNRVEFSVVAKDLQPGHAYTVWLMVLNRPDNCHADRAHGDPLLRCGGASDHLGQATEFSIVYGGGAWVAEDGTLTVQGSRPAMRRADAASHPDVVLGPGLVHPEAAEVHIRLRDHGPAQSGLEDDQIGTFAGGCTAESSLFMGSGTHGTYECVDVSATAS